MILSSTQAALQNISYPQDVNLLSEVRENLEGMIDEFCYEYGYYRPRTYRKTQEGITGILRSAAAVFNQQFHFATKNKLRRH